MASANLVILQGLLERGHQIDWFSKSRFVDPRRWLSDRPGFHFHESDNGWVDRLRDRFARVPGLGFLLGRWDAASYHRLLIRRMRHQAQSRRPDVVVWLGEYARGTVPGVPTVSWTQGPPGTDARSILRHAAHLRRVAAPGTVRRLEWLARLRLSPLGLPPFAPSDRLIVGSRQAAERLRMGYRLSADRLGILPYPIDPADFPLVKEAAGPEPGPLRILWLGRIVPRKRLDLLLAAVAGVTAANGRIQLTVVGRVGFPPGYEAILREFPHRDRLDWREQVPREAVASLMREADVLVQPSEEENFGSSVAEAQLCGLPVIVGQGNGNADYLSPRDRVMEAQTPEALAAIFRELADKKAAGTLGEPSQSRAVALEHFAPGTVLTRFETLLREVTASGGRG